MPTTRKPIWILSVLAVIGGFWGADLAAHLGRGQEAYGMGLIADSIFVTACVCTAAVLASRPDRDA
jgi:hypothetical protein